jgi:hypothetical protein
MANTFHDAIELFEKIGKINTETVWVEIGSDRGEGSTLALAGQAQRWGTVLHSVDINDKCKRTVHHPSLICHVEKGSVWAKNYQTNVGQFISLLYLDNFDWIWNPKAIPPWIRDQIEHYQREHEQIMNNRRCQHEHLSQALFLTPWLGKECMVAMDDTYLQNSVWTGKCGAVCVYLEALGFDTVYTSDGGTIMVRGFDTLPRLTLDNVLCII